MPDPAPSILVVGSTMIDLIAYADVLPEAGQTVVGTGFAMGFGGKGANQAVAAARLGARVRDGQLPRRGLVRGRHAPQLR